MCTAKTSHIHAAMSACPEDLATGQIMCTLSSGGASAKKSGQVQLQQSQPENGKLRCTFYMIWPSFARVRNMCLALQAPANSANP